MFAGCGRKSLFRIALVRNIDNKDFPSQRRSGRLYPLWAKKQPPTLLALSL